MSKGVLSQLPAYQAVSKGVLSDGSEAMVELTSSGFIGSTREFAWAQWNLDGTPLDGQWPVLLSVGGAPLAQVRIDDPGYPIEEGLPPETGASRRREILERIASCVCRDRQNTYGDAEDNFQNIADYWTLWLRQRGLLAKDKEVDALDVAQMSAFIKVARKVGNLHYLDNWVDDPGYDVCGAGIVLSREGKT